MDPIIEKFKRLTKAQKNAMNHVAFHGFATDVIPRPATLQSLVDLGLVIATERLIGSDAFAVLVADYDMSLPVHYLWCCQVSEEDQMAAKWIG